MSANRGSISEALASCGRRVGYALLPIVLKPLESKVFRGALLTVLLISAVQQFVGWKYVGTLIRQVVAHVQDQVLPWSRSQDPDRQVLASKHKVVTLMIGDELFASRDGFGHQVPLPPDRVLLLLTAIFKAVPENARIVIDFDLAPRVGEDPKSRTELDTLLELNAGRLLLVEPSWASRNSETLAHQLDWAWRMCKFGPHRPVGVPDRAIARAVFVQSTLTSNFGVVSDSLPRSGQNGPAWDIGRAVNDQFEEAGRKRNPICDRLQGVTAEPSASANVAATDLPTLHLLLAKELQRYGALRIKPVDSTTKHRDATVLLRSEYVHGQAACEPKTFDEISKLPCLSAASVVMVGGSWSYGFGDRQDTFVGEVDGALVHAAWVQSWLQPAEHLNKLLDILLDVLIIEVMLHPVLKYTFEGTRRHADRYREVVNSPRARDGLGLHVAAMLGFLVLAVVAFMLTAFTLIVIDGLLRWAFDRALSLDTTILALLTWSVVEFNSAAPAAHETQPGRHHETFPTANACWLVGILVLSVTTVYAALGLSQVHSAAVPALVCFVLASVPAVYTVRAMLSGRHKTPGERDDADRKLDTRREESVGRLKATLGSVRRSLSVARSPHPSGAKSLLLRLADTAGGLLWLGIWGYGLWVLFNSALLGPMLEMLGG